MITDKEVKLMALTDMLLGIKNIRDKLGILGFGYEVDDALIELKDIFEFELDEIDQ